MVITWRNPIWSDMTRTAAGDKPVGQEDLAEQERDHYVKKEKEFITAHLSVKTRHDRLGSHIVLGSCLMKE